MFYSLQLERHASFYFHSTTLCVILFLDSNMRRGNSQIRNAKQCSKHLAGALPMSQRAYEDFRKNTGDGFRDQDLEFHSELAFAIASLRKANSMISESLKVLEQLEN
jgi:hypothetical protein